MDGAVAVAFLLRTCGLWTAAKGEFMVPKLFLEDGDGGIFFGCGTLIDPYWIRSEGRNFGGRKQTPILFDHKCVLFTKVFDWSNVVC